MKRQFNAVAALCAATTAGTFCPKFSALYPRVNLILVVNQVIVEVLLSLFLLVFFQFQCCAQDQVTFQVVNLEAKIIAPSILVPKDSAATLRIGLGSESSPIKGAKSFQLELKLGPNASFSDPASISFDSAWISSGGICDILINYDVINHVLLVKGLAPDIWPDGHGELCRLRLSATKDELPANELIAGGTGIIEIADVGFKVAETVLDNPFSAYDEGKVSHWYPNPFRGDLFYQGKEESPKMILVLDSKGEIVMQLNEGELWRGQLPAAQLPPGLYWVKTIFPSGKTAVQTVIKQD